MVEVNMKVLCLVLSCSVVNVMSHGTMVKPNNWFDRLNWFFYKGRWVADYIGMKSSGQCTPGCTLLPDDICQSHGNCQGYPKPGCSCWWYKNYTFVEKPTIFDSKLLTFQNVSIPSNYLHHPWRAPGSAAVDNPCGVAGGNFDGCIDGPCAINQGGYSYGMKATDVKFHYEIKVTEWKRGTIAEVAWGIQANHGGGYSYRLCKLSQEGVKGLTEQCFQQTPLAFVGGTQWIQYGEDTSTRFSIPAVRTDVGTTPVGSQWTRNPIPACNGDFGGFFSPTGKCTNGTQFPPPRPGLSGYGLNLLQTMKPFPFSIVDKVYIPHNLEVGDYVLSFRWDTEQTPQVWNTCASIKLL